MLVLGATATFEMASPTFQVQLHCLLGMPFIRCHRCINCLNIVNDLQSKAKESIKTYVSL